MIKSLTHTTLAAGALTAALGLSIAAPALATSHASQAAKPSIPPCRTADLSARIGAVDAGAGQRYAELILTNHSRHTCHTYGFVGLQFLDKWGKPLPTQAIRDRSQAQPKRVVVGARALAQSQLHWSVIPGIGDSASIGQCEVPTRVEITPPDETTHLTIRWNGSPVCEGGTVRMQPLKG